MMYRTIDNALARRLVVVTTSAMAVVLLLVAPARAQLPSIRYGSKVSPDVKAIYERGLQYLATSQLDDGSWGQQQRNGVTSLCILAFLAEGEDPNFGRYSSNIRRALRSLIGSQDPRTGYFNDSMYHHGFAMLALAEAYGAVDDSTLWDNTTAPQQQRSIGVSLELSVRAAITAQQRNRMGGWRYSPTSNDADTSVSGAVLVGLLAARNAGIEVPDENIEKALNYYKSSTSDTGMVAYSGGVGGFGESMNRSAVATLVYAVGKKKDWKEYEATLEHIRSRMDHQESSFPEYFRYYMAQALFQGDFDAWTKWDRENTRMLRETQSDDGSFAGSFGPAYGTSMSLLSIALNYRFLPIYER